MKVKKCPACKNEVSWEGYCCPRCGIEFRAMRIRRVLFWLVVLGLGTWIGYHYFWQGS